MLKKRTKSFAPAKVGPRKAGAPSSTPSSARPSVEPRGKSQTPAPPQTQPEIIVLDAPALPDTSTVSTSQNLNPTPSSLSHEIRGHFIAKTPEPGETSTSSATLKRKAGDDVITEAPAKRVATDTHRNATPAPEIVITPVATDLPQGSNQSRILHNSAAHEHNSNLNPSKRKKIKDGQPQSPAKIVSPSPEKQSDGNASQSDPTIETPSTNQPVLTIADTPTTPNQLFPSQIIPSIEASQNAPTNLLPTPQTTQRATPQLEGQTPESESQDESPEPPRYRYPSPDNIPPVAGQIISISPGRASMGPPGGGAAGVVGPVASGPELVLSATLNPDGSSSVAQIPVSDSGKAKKPKRKYTKRKKVQPIDEESDRANLSLQLNKPSGDKRKGKKKKEKKPRKKRDETPDGAEDEEIDATTMTMSELCSDLKIGKKSKHHDEIMGRLQKQRADLAAEKFRKTHPEMVELVEGEEGAAPQEGEAVPAGEGGEAGEVGEAGPSGENEEANNGETATPDPIVGSGPQMRIVDGHLVLDEASLQIDRHKRADLGGRVTKTIEENQFTRVITAGTFMKRERAQQWDDEEMDLFYKGLRMFGTDFQMISQLFPTRNRRQVKLKFNSEEKKNPRMITKALCGVKDEIDIEEYQRISNVKLEPIEAIRAEHDAFEAEQNAELERIAAAQAEETRQKKASIHAGRLAAKNLLDSVELSEDEDQPGGSAKENSDPKGKGKGKGKQKAKPRKNKNKHSMHGGGEEVIVDGRID